MEVVHATLDKEQPMNLSRTLPRRAVPAAVALSVALGLGVLAPSASAAAATSPASTHSTTQQHSAPLLQVGSRGQAVREWQSLLNRVFTGRTIDHPVLAVDGEYGPRTASGTRALQAAAGLTRDGIVGPKTRAALPALLPGATGTPPVSVARSLSVGSRGADVADWQRDVNRLRAAGTVDTRLLAVDGVFGPATRAGTLAVQERAGITRDGVVGPVTRRSAARLLAG